MDAFQNGGMVRVPRRCPRASVTYCLLSALAFAAAAWPSSLLASPAADQHSPRLEGRVVHEATGAPVAGASVSIVGARGLEKTDSDGRFTWLPAPAAPFQVIVVLPGGHVAKPVAVDALQNGILTIRVKALTDESLTVLGAAPSIDAPPGSATTILSGTQVAQRGAGTLAQALENVPGLGQISEGHAAVPTVRGLARGRTLILIDGGRVTAERRVGPSASFLDPSVTEGIDIARGPGSVAYGSDALGGVISVRTRRAEPGAPWKVRATGLLGAGVPEARGSLEVSKGLARGGVLVQSHVRTAEDYDSPQGGVFNSGWQDRGLLVSVTHAVGKGFLAASWQSDYAVDVERPRNNSRLVRFIYPFENSHRLTASYELPAVAGFRQIALTGFWGAYDNRTDQDRVPTATSGRSLERADVAANDFHLKASAERLAGATRLEFGIDINGRFNLRALETRRTFDLSGELLQETTDISIDNAQRIDLGAYFQAERALGRHARLSTGLRGDRVTTRNPGGFFGNRSTSNAAASGFGALTLGPFDGFSVTGQVSRGFRDPVLSDRYYRGPSGRGFVTGNPGLTPETSLQFDLAARYTLPRTQLAAYLYHYRIANLIERYETDLDFFFFRNRGRAALRGIELEARSELGRGYSIETAAHVGRGRALDDSAHLDDVPADTVSVLARKQFEGRGYAHAGLTLVARDDRPGPSEVAAPGAMLLNAGAGWRVNKWLDMRVSTRNLLDDEYYASPDPRWVLAPGRSAAVTAVVEF